MQRSDATEDGDRPDAARMEERIAALAVHCQLGPSFNRSVVSHIADARHLASRGWHDGAYRHLLLAEVCAGVLTWERFCELDPFQASRP